MSDIEQPDSRSVQELRQWLARFGDEQKEHFEKNQVNRFRGDEVVVIPDLPTPQKEPKETLRILAIDRPDPGSSATECTSETTVSSTGWHPNARPTRPTLAFDDDDDLLDSYSLGSTPRLGGKPRSSPMKVLVGSVRRKLPLLRCKSVPETPTFASSPKDPFPFEDPESPFVLKEVRPFPFAEVEEKQPCRETPTPSAKEPTPSSNLSDVFAEAAASSSWRNSPPPAPSRWIPEQPVAQVVRQFGGKRSSVEIRKAQLQRKWAEQRAPTHTKKVEWQVCQATGTYKKKITLKY